MLATLTAWRVIRPFTPLPKAEIVARWYEQTHDNFRFCFKFPATISHQAALRHCDDLSHEFFTRLAPLETRIASTGCSCPPPLAPETSLPCGTFSIRCRPNSPMASKYGIRSFSPKGTPKRRSIAGWHQRHVNRAILDSRPVHSAIARNPAMIDAQRKKPKLPVHGRGHGGESAGSLYRQRRHGPQSPLFGVWLQTLPQWSQSTTPYLFLHTPDIAQAPELVSTLWEDLRRVMPEVGTAPSIPQQTALF